VRGIVFVFALLALSISAFALPDLVVNSVQWYPGGDPQPGSTVTISVLVVNVGNTSAGYSFTALRIDGNLRGPVMIGPLLPYGAASANFTYTVTPNPDPHILVGIADYYNNVSESNELNNNLTAYMDLSTCGDGRCNSTTGENCSNCPQDCGPCPKPDLTIVGMGYSPRLVRSGRLVTVYSDVKNIGNANASGFTVRTTIYPQGIVCNNWIGFVLNPNQVYRVYCNYTAGNTTSIALTYADINNQVQESNEYNNNMTITIPLGAVPIADEVAMAQVEGPNLIPENVPDLQALKVAVAFCLASLAAIIFHAFMKMEVHT